MNDWKAIGRLTKDPETPTEYASGAKKLVLCLAVQRDRTSKDGATADFININVWNNQADLCHRTLHKGSRIAVSCHLQSNTYEDKETGKKRSSLDVIMDRFEYLDRKSDQPQAEYAAVPQQQQPSYDDFTQIDTADLPF